MGLITMVFTLEVSTVKVKVITNTLNPRTDLNPDADMNLDSDLWQTLE